MFNFCVFGAQCGELSFTKKLYVTLFGGCDLKRPTIAKQVLIAKRRGNPESLLRGQFFLTVFGAVEIKSPTLAEEFLDLQDAMRSGLLTWSDWDDAVARLSLSASGKISSLTLFGGMESNALPTEDEELDALALSQHLGRVSDVASRTLMLAVGQAGAQRPAAVRHAVAAVA